MTGHLWTGPSSNQATEGAALTRAQGQEYLRLLVEALIKDDEANRAVTTTNAFLRVSYQCGTHGWGPFMVETHSPDEEFQREWARVSQLKAPLHFPYSRVQGTIAVA